MNDPQFWSILCLGRLERASGRFSYQREICLYKLDVSGKFFWRHYERNCLCILPLPRILSILFFSFNVRPACFRLILIYSNHVPDCLIAVVSIDLQHSFRPLCFIISRSLWKPSSSFLSEIHLHQRPARPCSSYDNYNVSIALCTDQSAMPEHAVCHCDRWGMLFTLKTLFFCHDKENTNTIRPSNGWIWKCFEGSTHLQLWTGSWAKRQSFWVSSPSMFQPSPSNTSCRQWPKEWDCRCKRPKCVGFLGKSN